jgi:IS5 family transposase
MSLIELAVCTQPRRGDTVGGYGRVRYRSLVRNALQLQLLAVALNLRHTLALHG